MNFPVQVAKVATSEGRSSIKTAGVVGARGKVEGSALPINFNHGNFIHGTAARRLLASHKELDDRFRRPLTDKDIEEFRATVSHIVFVQANFIWLGHDPWERLLAHYRILADNFERLKLPIVPLGFGAQSATASQLEYRVHPDILHLLQVVSGHAVDIAVRGEFTAEACRRLGLANVKAVGCQSLFWHRTPTLTHLLEGGADEGRPTSFNFTDALVEHDLINQAISADFDMIGQGMSAEEALVQRQTSEAGPIPHLIRTDAAFKRGLVDREQYDAWVRKRFFQFGDAEAWVQHMRRYRLSYGTRFHGNMAAYIAGAPALWITHDSRTTELCELFHLPSIGVNEVKSGVDLDTLYARANYDETVKAYPERYRAMVDYLSAAGLNHTLLAPPVDEGAGATNSQDAALAVIQLRTDTAYNRYPWVFKAAAAELLAKSDSTPASLKLLSFGCSRGDEVFALADKYFTEATIVGVDVVAENLQKAQLANNSPERIFFELSSDKTFDKWKPFDAIFAMSVLCSWPGALGKDDITDVFSFAQFEAILAKLDSVLKLGGLLCIYNANYRMLDTRFAAAYERAPVSVMLNSGFVSKFDKDCKRRPEFDADKDIIFRKIAETPPAE